MRFASVAQVKAGLSRYIALARKKGEPIIITRYGRPWAVIQSLSEEELEALEWRQLALQKLSRTWKGEAYSLYTYL